MSKEIRFLIIVPTYNSSRILGRLVNSLKNQTFQNWNTLFIDAYSNKENEDLLFNYIKSDKRFSLKRETEEFKGIFPSMTLGAKSAIDGDWVIFLGSDDWFSSNLSLDKIAKDILDNKKFGYESLGIIYKTQFLKSGNNKLLRYNKIPAKDFIDKNKLGLLMFFGYVPVHQSVCFSAELLKKLMPYSHKYILASDCELFFKLSILNQWRIIVLDDVLINIQAGGLSSRHFYRRIKEVLLIYIRKYKFYFLIPFLLRYLRKFFLRIRNVF